MFFPPPRPASVATPGATPATQAGPMGTDLTGGLGQVLMALGGGEGGGRMPLPQTAFPEQPRSMNPAYSQMVLQMLMGAGQSPVVPSLGASLSKLGG